MCKTIVAQANHEVYVTYNQYDHKFKAGVCMSMQVPYTPVQTNPAVQAIHGLLITTCQTSV